MNQIARIQVMRTIVIFGECYIARQGGWVSTLAVIVTALMVYSMTTDMASRSRKT